MDDKRCIAVCSVVGLLFLAMPHLLVAQAQWADSSRLRDSVYVLHSIKDISDEELFAAMDLSAPAYLPVRAAAEKKNYRNAYAHWGELSLPRPHYLSKAYHLLIDTETLVSYDAMKAYMRANPDERDTVITRSNEILRNIIHTWGSNVIDFGDSVDFNREIGQSGKYGFHYWRWGHPLNTAYLITGDTAYIRKFDALFNRWYAYRNRITGGFQHLDVVYYELGLGIRNRVFLEFYLLDDPHRTPETHEHMLKTMLGAGRWLYQLQRWEGYRPGNWQIHGSYMLTQIALAFPEFRESKEWLKMGLQRLEEHMHEDFLADGGHSERSPRNYTLATYMSYRNLYYLLTAYHADEPMAEEIRATMGKTIDWWLAMLAPTGEIPSFNDSWRGLFPVEVLEDGAAFYHKPEVYGVIRSLFGVSHSGDTTYPSFVSRHMPASGFTIMRTDWTRNALTMTLSYGPFSGFHTHADVLGFEMYAYGRAMAVDAGLGMTDDDTLYVPWYQSSRAHNMVIVNETNIDRRHTEGKNIVYEETPRMAYFSGEHDGYASLGVHLQRRVAFVKPSYWFMVDEITGHRSNDTLSWYLHSPTTLRPGGNGYRSVSAPGLIIMPASNRLTTRTGSGWSASTTDYTPGATQLINWIAYDQITGADSLYRFPVLLYPFRNTSPHVTVSAVSADCYEVTLGDTTDTLLFPRGFAHVHGFSTDGDFLLIRSVNGTPRSFSVANATYVRYHERSLWTSPRRAPADGTLTE
jgi:Heparinase II/III N-terminus/Heparinase II/III-like protein